MGVNAPLDIEVTLDRSHGEAPSRIQVARNSGLGALWTEDYRVTHFERHGNDWITTAAESEYSRHDSGKHEQYHRVWSLKRTLPCDQIRLTMPDSQGILDYRLLGSGLTLGEFWAANKTHGDDILKYQWHAVGSQLPTELKLAKMRRKLPSLRQFLRKLRQCRTG